PPPAQRKTETPPLEPLPLLPAPVYSSDAQRNALVDLALMRAAERHPELVEGPEIDDTYAVAVALREDGIVVTSAAKLRTREKLRDVAAEIERSLPRDGAGSNMGRPKGTLLPNGRALRANVMLRVDTLSMSYDVSRSNLRVRQILGNQYADQMLPIGGDE